jgi:transmembrane 9 superfamily protein 2/4
MATNRIALGFSALFVLFLIAASVVSIYREGALFIPGLSPTVFKKDDQVQLSVNKITSIHEPIPYRYNDLPVCTPPPDKIQPTSSENIGAIVTGDRIENSVFEVSFQLVC